MPPSKTAPVWVSLNEIESTAVKAARSAGYGWGLAGYKNGKVAE